MKNTKIISASISDEFFNLAKKHGISWSEAMKIGLMVLFIERGLKTKNDLNSERVNKLNNYLLYDYE